MPNFPGLQNVVPSVWGFEDPPRMLAPALGSGPDEPHDWREVATVSFDGGRPAPVHACSRCGMQVWQGSAGSLQGVLDFCPLLPRTCAEALVAAVMNG